MKRLTIMMVAGEPSGDLLGAELVTALRAGLALECSPETHDLQPLSCALEPAFFGAAGARMAEAGVEQCADLTKTSVIGPSDVLGQYLSFRKTFFELLREAELRQPDVIVLIDYSHFNQKLARALRRRIQATRAIFSNWDPLIVKYVSPQVWASRPKRVFKVARDFDLLLCILPFEEQWYARRVPHLKAVYVGHWIMDRYPEPLPPRTLLPDQPQVLLLPGSRPGEVARHTQVLLEAAALLKKRMPIKPLMVLPNAALERQVRAGFPIAGDVQLQIGGLPKALLNSDLAIASTGSVTMECARFLVPTIALYRTSWLTYHLAKRVITIRYLSMPNILADEPLFPEFIQNAATPEALSEAGFELLTDAERRQRVKSRLADVVRMLGSAGAHARAANEIIRQLREREKLPRLEPNSRTHPQF